MNTQLQFLSDTFQFEIETSITATGEDDDGPYVVTGNTVFYPGGGGQEPDKGYIVTITGEKIPILKARIKHQAVRHYLPQKITETGPASIHIDPEYRIQNARLHTAGHLLSSVVFEKLQWPLKPVKGFHYQQGAYVEFEPEEEMPEILEPVLSEALAEDIARKLPVSTCLVLKDDPAFLQAFKPENFVPPTGKPLRLVKIDSYLAIPCGGTHVSDTGDLKGFKIKNIKNKKGRIRISYEAG